MIDPTGKTFHRLGMQLPGCPLIPCDDYRVAATGSRQIEAAVAAVPSLTATQAPAPLREAGAGVVRRLFDVVRNLPMRFRECPMPLELDDHVLRDIGLTRVEYRFLLMSRATTAPIDRKNSKNLHDGPAAFFKTACMTRALIGFAQKDQEARKWQTRSKTDRHSGSKNPPYDRAPRPATLHPGWAAGQLSLAPELAGLSVAGALAKSFDQVDVLERHDLATWARSHPHPPPALSNSDFQPRSLGKSAIW